MSQDVFVGGLTERQMLQLALEESKNAALAAKAAAGESERSSDEDNSDCDSGDGSSAYGARAGGGKVRRAGAKEKALTQKAAGALCEQAFLPCCHRAMLLHMVAGLACTCITVSGMAYMIVKLTGVARSWVSEFEADALQITSPSAAHHESGRG